jgi:DNA-binding MarR family transcriptional regulator
MKTSTGDQAAELRGAIDALTRRFKIAEAEVPAGKPLNQLDIQVLFFVADHPACGPTDVARYLGVPTTTISSATDRLTRQGMLRRERPEENRRSIALSVTEAGHAYVRALVRVQTDHCRIMLEKLTPEEQRLFVALFTKIASNED